MIKENGLVYIVSTVSIKEKTEEKLKEEFEIHKIKYPKWQNSTFEDFCEFKKGWNQYKYTMHMEDSAYFLNFDEAKDFVVDNTSDINDGGVFNYAVIKAVATKKAYANLLVDKLSIFKYDIECDKYIEVKLDSNEEVRYILKQVSPLL